MKSTFTLFFILFFSKCAFTQLTSVVLTQTNLFEEGISGVKAEFHMSFPANRSILGIHSSYTIKGRLTTGISATQNSFEGFGNTGFSLRPYVDYLLIRQKKGESPIHLGIQLGYKYFKYTQEINTRAVSKYGIGATITREVKIMDDLTFYPSVKGIWSKQLTLGMFTGTRDSYFHYDVYLTVKYKNFYVSPVMTFASPRNVDRRLSVHLGTLLPLSSLE